MLNYYYYVLLSFCICVIVACRGRKAQNSVIVLKDDSKISSG